jgi:hypothetical protein
MYRMLLAGTALSALASPLAAQTVIDTSRTTPVRTSELNSGQGADLRIATAGAITLTAGDAITVDSNHDVTNDGKITVTNANGADGILVTGPRTADIVNTGTITIDETYTPTDADNDGDLDGPFAVGSNRAAIRVDGALTGNVSHSGTIVVEGNDSAGIRIDGPLTGNLRHDGKTTVTGDRSVGVSARDITGDVRLAGTVAVKGQGAVGAYFDGDVDGAMVIQGDISATGYRATTAPADVSKLDADDLLQGGGAVIVEGDVGKGIVFAVAPRDAVASDNDEDKDGIEDAKEGSAKVVSYGSAAAVTLGAADRDIAIGATQGTGTGFGVIVEGAISGEGVYSGVAANGMVIGGRGGDVTIAGGMLVGGTVSANAREAAATALRIGAGTTLPELRNSGSITAASTGTNATTATAVLIEAGATVPTIRNSGTIKASTTATAGSAAAIVDQSGTLALVENSGRIEATGAAADSGRNVAIDLSARASGATVRQTAVAAGVTAPIILGDIKFGAGADILEIGDGQVRGKVTFGAGSDRLILKGDGVFIGDAVFDGAGDTLTILDTAAFSGRLIGSQNLAVSVAGGFLDLRGATSIASLDVGATGVIVATLDPDTADSTAITVGGTASFAQGAKIAIRLTDITDAEGTYNVLTAGTLVGADKLTADSALVPFLYKAALAVAGNTVTVDIDRKATSELGLNTSEGQAFDALFAALGEDGDVAAIFLGINEGALFQAYVAQTLPDHAGGTFEGVGQGLRSFDRHLIDPAGAMDEEGKLRVVADITSWNGHKERGDSASYDLDGLGIRGGLEYLTGIGAFGVTGSWLWSEHTTGVGNEVMGNSYEFGAHWRGKFGPVQTFARGAFGTSDFEGTRSFVGGTGEDAVNLTILGDWSGKFVSASGGASIEGGSQFFFFRPSIVFDYLRLKEDGYEETGGGDALNLTVGERKSDELAANLGMAVGADLWGMQARDGFWLRLEAEGGWRQILGGELGSTTAQYGDGDEFTLTPEQRESGWFARARGYGGDGWYRVGGEVGLEEQFGEIGYSLRASLRFGW